MATFNTATSIVDYLRSTGKPSDFNSRKALYESSGLSGAFGDYRGTAEQNTTLLNKVKAPAPAPLAPAPAAPVQQAAPAVSQEYADQQARLNAQVPAGSAGAAEIASRPAPVIKPAEVVKDTTPQTNQNIYDLLFEQEKKAAAKEQKDLTLDLSADTTRAATSLTRDVASLKRESNANIFNLEEQGDKAKTTLAENAAGFGGAGSGMVAKEQREVDTEVSQKREQLRQKLGDQLYNSFSEFERNYGTKFLESLSVPEANEFVKLPVAVRGIVMQNYQENMLKAQEKAQKNALATLEKLGYTVVGGQIVPTLQRESADRAEDAAARSEQRLQMAEQRANAPDVVEFVRGGRRIRQLLDPTTKQVVQEIDLGDSGEAGSGGGSGGGTQTERELVKYGGHTREEFKKGATVAGVPEGDFMAFDEQSRNYFIYNSSAVNDVKEEISGKKNGKELAKEDAAIEARADLPAEVRNSIRRHIRSQLTTEKMRQDFKKQGRVL